MNIVCRGSPTDRFIQMRSLYFPNDVSRLDVAVLRPPNMGNQTEKFAFLKVLEQLESTKCSTGRKQTKFWFFGYLSYLNEMGFDDTTEDLNYTEFREQLQPFLLNSAKFSYDIIENEDGSLKQFRLSLGLKTLATDDQILECAKEMRRNCENNRNTFNIQTYSPLWNLAGTVSRRQKDLKRGDFRSIRDSLATDPPRHIYFNGYNVACCFPVHPPGLLLRHWNEHPIRQLWSSRISSLLERQAKRHLNDHGTHTLNSIISALVGYVCRLLRRFRFSCNLLIHEHQR